jgi:hypothetical protein
MMNRLRVVCAIAGLLAGVLSVALDDHRLAWGAIALLAMSLIFRILVRQRESRAGHTRDGV